MHQEAYEGFGRMLAMTGIDRMEELDILDVGGADVNGSVRDYFPNAHFSGLDIEPAPGVDYVFDAAVEGNWGFLHGGFDIVMATELAEHAERWEDIVANMATALDPQGPELFFTTCASTGRPPHGARGEWGVPAGQWYRNIPPAEMEELLERHFQEVHVEYNPNPGDCYAWARSLK